MTTINPEETAMKITSTRSLETATKNNKPFQIYLQHTGKNESNESGKSFKFYEIIYRGDGKCSLKWGRIGNKASEKQVDLSYALKKLKEKLRKGYYFCQP